ncbi:sulfatase [Alteromonas sp. 1_MG-2023]|uniref:sulfatase family protein n=1 Tax=Alteromonas sp. 1_MG-2023 TaxID=3062669 RepID=UPI0026E43336|nr:sulfatase [Alteromonas sp. 1_MG-2023]MDO6476113.1 sulfatase [Alteromonas sp. 1_MG-2023]
MSNIKMLKTHHVKCLSNNLLDYDFALHLLNTKITPIALLILVMPMMLYSNSVAANNKIQDRPNILLIVAEDMSSHLNSFGDIQASTPNIDELASEGIVYTNTYTAAGVCSVSRSALITGMYPISIGTQHHSTGGFEPKGYEAVPPPEIKAFPELLRRAGYVTANFAKRDYQFGEPFTIWDIDTGNFLTEDAPPLWRELPKDKPFFVMINLMATHESRLMPAGEKADHPFGKNIERLATRREEIVQKVTNSKDVTVPPYYPDTTRVRENFAQFYDNIHYMDSQVGQLIEQLKNDNLFANTVIIWTTDHGDGMPRAKRSVYDSGLHVPMVITNLKRYKKGIENNSLISFVDLAPTILTLANVEVPEYLQGRNFLDDNPRQYIYASRDRMDETNNRVRAVRDERFLYVRNYDSKSSYYKTNAFRDMFPIMQELISGNKNGTLNEVQDYYFMSPHAEEELYDTANDPHQIENLATNNNYQHKLTELQNALDNWLATVGDASEKDELTMLKLMWPDLRQPQTQPVLVEKSGSKLILKSQTLGASISFREELEGVFTPWQIYTQPVDINLNNKMEFKAIRYGYKESEITFYQP